MTFTDTQRDQLAHLLCPDCGSILIDGPQGGAAQNFYCVERRKCRQGFNLTFMGDGELAFADRIGEVDDERFAHWAPADWRPPPGWWGTLAYRIAVALGLLLIIVVGARWL